MEGLFQQEASKQALKLDQKLQDTLKFLIQDIRESGPVRGDWPNYSKLADGSRHCHLDYRHVACWSVHENEIEFVEICYVGSRKDAPYD